MSREGGDGKDLRTKVPQGVQLLLREGRPRRPDASGHRLRRQGERPSTSSASHCVQGRSGSSSSCSWTVKTRWRRALNLGSTLERRDHWDRPDDAADEHAHLMVQCMEAWFLADLDALAAYFGQGFNRNALPGRQEFEEVAKADLFDALKNATRQCRKGEYGKGRHSFDILEQIDADKVRECIAARVAPRRNLARNVRVSARASDRARWKLEVRGSPHKAGTASG